MAGIDFDRQVFVPSNAPQGKSLVQMIVPLAVVAALDLGSSFGAPTTRETTIAEAVVAAVPSIEKVRFVSSGTEAAMSAVRVARSSL